MEISGESEAGRHELLIDDRMTACHPGHALDGSRRQKKNSSFLSHGRRIYIIMYFDFFVASESAPISGSTASAHEIRILFMATTLKAKLFLTTAQLYFNAFIIGLG